MSGSLAAKVSSFRDSGTRYTGIPANNPAQAELGRGTLESIDDARSCGCATSVRREFNRKGREGFAKKRKANREPQPFESASVTEYNETSSSVNGRLVQTLFRHGHDGPQVRNSGDGAPIAGIDGGPRSGTIEAVLPASDRPGDDKTLMTDIFE